MKDVFAFFGALMALLIVEFTVVWLSRRVHKNYIKPFLRRRSFERMAGREEISRRIAKNSVRGEFDFEAQKPEVYSWK